MPVQIFRVKLRNVLFNIILTSKRSPSICCSIRGSPIKLSRSFPFFQVCYFCFIRFIISSGFANSLAIKLLCGNMQQATLATLFFDRQCRGVNENSDMNHVCLTHRNSDPTARRRRVHLPEREERKR
jgi:hypothetical protein